MAITGNLTVVGQTRAGYLAITPTRVVNPPTSTLNFPLGDVRANGVTVPLNGDGDIWIVYKAAGGSDPRRARRHRLLPPGHGRCDIRPRYDPRPDFSTHGAETACPIRSPRITGGRWDVAGRGGVGSDATAIIGNVTVVGQTKAGYVALTPTQQANLTTSTINFPLGDIRANNFTVQLSGQISSKGFLAGIYKAVTGARTHLVVDVTGYYK